jgi:catechol 2,3-dioxygenase-like lactoylglutathione lyase family enzyme
MTDRPKGRLLRSAPYLPVADIERAASHYEQVLGFRRDYVGGEPPEFAIVSRDGVAIMLRLVPDASAICPNERQGGTWDVFLWVEGLDGLYAEFVEAGADIVYGPVLQTAYHMREFAIRAPDGHVLGFGEAVAEPIQ